MDWRLGDRPSTGNTNAATRRPFGCAALSPLVGRADELRRLSDALDLVAEGHGGTIFLTGQPGIGKTRLAREALCLAKARCFRVLEGRAYPVEAGLAYAPVLDAFDPLVHHLDPVRLSALVAGLPELGRLFDGLGLPLPEPLGDPALEKTRLHRAVARLLERLTQEAPLVLFVDDVQWADPASLELLHYLARGLSHQRGLLIATYSGDNLDASRKLRSLLVSLGRVGLAQEIVVPSLGRDAVDKLVRGILGGQASDRLASIVDARAGGTPLFVEALIDSLVEPGHLVWRAEGWDLDVGAAISLPPSVRQAIVDRLDRLAPIDRVVVDLIAVMGDGTNHSVLQAASELGEETLLDALRRLRAIGIVAEGLDSSEVTYRLTHPLFQEVACDELPVMARRRVRLRAIDIIEPLSEGRPDAVGRLVRHCREAGSDPDRTLAALLAAGDRAWTLYSNEEAGRHYSAALGIVREGCHYLGTGDKGRGVAILTTDPRTSSSDKEEPLLPRLLERLGDVWERIGEHDAAIKAWNEALAERELRGDALAASRLRRQLTLAEWARGNFEIAEAHLRAGLAALSGYGPCQELADLQEVRFHILSRLGDTAGVANTAAELLSVAELLASPRAEAEANLAVSTLSLWQGQVVDGRQHALRALTLGEQAQDLGICCRARTVLTLVGTRLGEHKFISYNAECGLAMAQRLGAPSSEVFLRSRMAYADFISGAWDESVRNSGEAIALARRVGHPRDLAYALAERAMILALQGHLSEAASCIGEVRLAFGHGSPIDRYVFGLVDIVETSLAIERGEIERALSIAKTFVHPPARAAIPTGLTISYMHMGLVLLAEGQVMSGDPKSALQTARAIIGLGPVGTPYLTALACRAEGLARHALGQQEAAITCFARAHERFIALEMPFEAARVLLDEATAAAVTQPRLAVRVAQQSLVAFEGLGAESHVGRARRLLGGFGISTLATRRPRVGGGYLSHRELKIAVLVAQGLTTPQIAEHLTISPRTVSNHLDHIYARLGIGTRTALARHVMEAGLVDFRDGKMSNR